MKARTVKAWCVTNGGGWPDMMTVARLRRVAIYIYGEQAYHEDSRNGLARVVKCTVTTEPKS